MIEADLVQSVENALNIVGAATELTVGSENVTDLSTGSCRKNLSKPKRIGCREGDRDSTSAEDAGEIDSQLLGDVALDFRYADLDQHLIITRRRLLDVHTLENIG